MAAGVTATLVVGLVPTASADALEAGNQGACSANFMPTMHAKARGNLGSQGPGNTTITTIGMFASYHTWNDLGVVAGGQWIAVSGGGDIDRPQTYGWCKKVA